MEEKLIAEATSRYARKLSARHGEGAYDVEMQAPPLPGQSSHSDYAGYFWKPFPPADPKWIAGKGAEETFVSIFVYHPSLSQKLRDNSLFVVQAFEFLYSIVMGIMGLLLISDIIAINHYAFVIAYSIVFAFFILVHFLSVWYWARQVRFSHKHNNEVQFVYFFFIAIYGAALVLIGRWLNRNPGSCCGFEESQPDESDAVTYNRYLMAYGFLLGGSIVMLYILARALVSHLYPEGRYVPSFDNAATTDIYIDEKDTPEEMKFLTTAAAGREASAPGHHHGSGKRRTGVRPASRTERGVAPTGAAAVFPSAHGYPASRPAEMERAWGTMDI